MFDWRQRDRRRAPAAVVASVLCLVVGCGAKKPTITLQRANPTSFSADEALAVVLLEYEDCDFGRKGKKRCDAAKDPTSEESKFLECLSRAEPRFRLISSSHVRQLISASSRAEVVEELSADSVRSRLLELDYRHLVLLNVSTSTRQANVAFDGEYVVWMIGNEKSKSSVLDAVVWDLEQDREAGSLRSISSGDKGFVVPVVLILPLPPVVWTSFTERRACRGLGEALGELLLTEK